MDRANCCKWEDVCALDCECNAHFRAEWGFRTEFGIIFWLLFVLIIDYFLLVFVFDDFYNSLYYTIYVNFIVSFINITTPWYIKINQFNIRGICLIEHCNILEKKKYLLPKARRGEHEHETEELTLQSIADSTPWLTVVNDYPDKCQIAYCDDYMKCNEV